MSSASNIPQIFTLPVISVFPDTSKAAVGVVFPIHNPVALISAIITELFLK